MSKHISTKAVRKVLRSEVARGENAEDHVNDLTARMLKVDDNLRRARGRKRAHARQTRTPAKRVKTGVWLPEGVERETK